MIDYAMWRELTACASCQLVLFPHFVWSVDRSLCYVNKEYDLGIFKDHAFPHFS